MNRAYLDIVAACETYLERHGDTYLGVGWTKRQEDADTRYRVMLDVMAPRRSGVSLLDFGCGASHLYEYMLRHGFDGVAYSGLDLSTKCLTLSRGKFPSIPYYQIDVLADDATLPEFDYVVLNGLFNYKGTMSFHEMLEYRQAVLTRVFAATRVGMAFNVMSTRVDWERDDLFHLPFDTLAAFLVEAISRHFVVRHDYGLYEYTTYVYRSPDSGAR